MIALKLQAVSHNTTHLIIADSTLLLWGGSRERNMADDERKESKVSHQCKPDQPFQCSL